MPLDATIRHEFISNGGCRRRSTNVQA
jgi:hypothetical protein